MSNVAAWLDQEIREAPASLRKRMIAALPADVDDSPHNVLAAAAFKCLRTAGADPRGENAALDLLCADALLTHACAAAAEAGADELARFVAACDANLFQQLDA